MAGSLFYLFLTIFLVIGFLTRSSVHDLLDAIAAQAAVLLVGATFALLTCPAVGWLLYQIYFFFYWNRPLKAFLSEYPTTPESILDKLASSYDFPSYQSIRIRPAGTMWRWLVGTAYVMDEPRQTCAEKIRSQWEQVDTLWDLHVRRADVRRDLHRRRGLLSLFGASFSAIVSAFVLVQAYWIIEGGFSAIFVMSGIVDLVLVRLALLGLVEMRTRTKAENEDFVVRNLLAARKEETAA